MFRELTNILRELGFNDKEIEIYSVLLPLGSASIRTIAEKTNINRGSVYDILESLANRGFITAEKKGSRRRFVVKSPEELLSSIEKKQKDFENQRKRITEAMPKLLSFYAKQGGRPSVEYFDDDSGIKKILEDVFKTVGNIGGLSSVTEDSPPKKEYCVYSSKSVKEYLYKLFPNFTREKIKRGIRTKVIALGGGGDPKNLKMAQRKEIGTDAPAYIMIYGPKIALISVADDKKPFGVIIKDEKIAKTQRIIFESLFEKI
ncbi:MAG: hypothetical protein A2909_01250 [Candidatus Tagabacteria bacterium RIFCSPLOWO2_01_FULL_39_11]|uniref:Transcription regulator TrmB N-terminal domain-containing protein n=1 Tax=Candidatus Tagabacteria bacterium RIFCSPLOWO2_01_FULL_39_11 TaxID=1802295 RepID=A0A1G2LSA7_9BACT|nr:MAG: hypothetical protein A2909_01250 [Candidatus Tagabacteria bacterium RIFCSPLOWO2_01_FULL_39_11]